MQHTASVIVTRPSSQAQEWLTALSEARFEVAALPLIQIALLDGLQLPAPLPLADYSAILFVSPNAVAGCVMQTKRKWVMATAEEWVRGAH